MNKNKILKTSALASMVAAIAAGALVMASPVAAQTTVPNVSQVAVLQHGRGGRGAPQMAEVAKALGMTEAELKTELQTGKSVAEIATAKNVSLDTIVSAVITAQTDLLKQAVTDGKLTQAQADTMLANLKLTLPSRLQTKFVAGMERGRGTRDDQGGPGSRGDRGSQNGAQIAIVVKALGITAEELRTELQAGKSVADVAAAKNVSISNIVDAVVAEQTTALKQAVTDGKLTQEQADQRLAMLKANLPKILELKGGFGPGFGGRGERGPKPGNTTPSTNSTPDPSL